MESIRKWFYKPKRDDTSLLAQFFYADEALNLVAAELDSFDGRKDPERCSALVNHLRQCQDKVLTICNRIMDDVIPDERANRDFRVKFPDDVMQENLAGQLWFGAECLAAGSSIMNREGESAAMRPLAKALTKALENVRNLLREQCLRGSVINSMKPSEVFSERLQEALKIFDRLFSEFELSYVSAMVPVKTPREYELQQLVVVLFSETLQRALQMKLLTQDMVDDYDPALMFTIPRLAIVSGLLIFPDGPLCLDKTPGDMSEMFRPFRTLLHKIRELLWTLNKKELYTLEKLLCSSEEPTEYRNSNSHQLEPESVSKDVDNNALTDLPTSYPTVPDLDDSVTRFYIDHPSCKQFVTDFYTATEIELDRWQVCATGLVEEGAIASWENTEESEDETEWVGETSECETVVTEILNSEEVSNTESERYVTCSDNEGKTSIIVSGQENRSYEISSQCISESTTLVDEGPVMVAAFPSSDTVPKEYPTISEPSQFSENIQQIPIVSTLPFPSSSLIAADFSRQNEEAYVNSEDHSMVPESLPDEQDSDLSGMVDLSSCTHQSSETIQIPNGNSGFLLANQVGHESILASIDGANLRDSDLDPGSGESLPDGDSREALSVATATLSTLLLSTATASPGYISPNQRHDGEDEPSVQSPIDSGLGTVVSCSDAGSFSDRSPDGAPTSALENGECKVDEMPVADCNTDTGIMNREKHQLETISCTCTLSSRSSPTSVSKEIESPEHTVETSPDSFCDQNGIITRLLVNSSPESNEESNHEKIVGKCDCEFSPNYCSSVCDISASSNNSTIQLNQDSSSSSLAQRMSDDINCLHSDCETLVCNRTMDHNCNEDAPVNSNSICENMMHTKSDLISDYHSASNNVRLSSTLAFSNSPVNNISSINLSEVRTSEERFYCDDTAVIPQELNLPSEVFDYNKTVPSVVVRMEEEMGDKEVGEEWVGVASGEGQCTLCSSNNGNSDTQSKLGSELDYSSNWDYLRVQASGSKQESSPSSEQRRAIRWRGKRKGISQSKRQSQYPSAKVVPNYTNRNLEPIASSYSSTCSSCQSSVTLSSDSCSTSSDTSSFNSECQDDEEIALAMQAAEIANRNEARAKFRSSEDLVHRLFVCIAGVADQLQTNFAGDLRNILKCVFLMSASSSGDSSSESEPDLESQMTEQDVPSPGENDSNRPIESAEEALSSGWESPPSPVEVESPPPWVPDDMAPRCMACEAVFNVVRRRHHCRNCGKVFCARCSSNSVPLPRYGHVKPVRVCNRCFLYQVTPFTLEEVAASRS